MGFSGLWRGVLRVKSGRRRGADGRFYRGIPGFLAWVRARGGDSAYGGRCRVLGAKKFLKFFKKGWKTEKLGCGRRREVVQGQLI